MCRKDGQTERIPMTMKESWCRSTEHDYSVGDDLELSRVSQTTDPVITRISCKNPKKTEVQRYSSAICRPLSTDDSFSWVRMKCGYKRFSVKELNWIEFLELLLNEIWLAVAYRIAIVTPRTLEFNGQRLHRRVYSINQTHDPMSNDLKYVLLPTVEDRRRPPKFQPW